MANVKGTFGDDILRGTIYGDIISAGRGNDTVYDRGGAFIASDDFVFGGKGDDWLQSISGNDKLFGGTGDDAFQVTLNCDPHNEGFNRIIRGGAGLDEITFVDPQNIDDVRILSDHIDVIDKAGGVTSLYGIEHYSFDF